MIRGSLRNASCKRLSLDRLWLPTAEAGLGVGWWGRSWTGVGGGLVAGGGRGKWVRAVRWVDELGGWSGSPGPGGSRVPQGDAFDGVGEIDSVVQGPVGLAAVEA